MRPEDDALNIFATVRATAKMREFRVAQEDFIDVPRDPKLLFSLAVGILGDVAARIADDFTMGGDDQIPELRPVTWKDDSGSVLELARFSARFFDAFLEAQFDQDITVEFSLLCTAAYYLSANPGSAAVIIRNSVAPELSLGHGLGLLAHKILKNELLVSEAYHAEGVSDLIIGALNRYFSLADNKEEIVYHCQNIRKKAYDNGSARELFYSDLVTAICSRKLYNSSINLIPGASDLSVDAWKPSLAKSHFPIELWPAQQRLCDADLLRGRSAVIQMPTSAGKTRATELIIRAAFLSGRASLAVIVAPFRSLCHDIRGDLAIAFAQEDVLISEASDSYQLDVNLEETTAQKTVLIVTPEKLLYILRREPEFVQSIRLVIYDEGHQFDGFTRGPTYELLLSTLRLKLPEHSQVLLISAVIGNASEVAKWLVGDETAVVSGEGLLPTSKSIAFASWEHQRGWVRYVNPIDPDDEEFFVPRIISPLPLARKSRRERERVFPERGRADFNEGQEVGLYLGLHLVANGSVALFCGQKESVTSVCRRVAEIFEREVELNAPIDVSHKEEIKRLVFLTQSHLGERAYATLAAKLGVFAHHSSTPHGLRLAIEYAMKEGHAKFTICTSTLAQGVNFPIKYLIITTTQQGRERIMVRDFHNLMGRAGRSGMYTEGSVIFSAPKVHDDRHLRSGRWRWNAAKELLDPMNAEPCSSSILEMFSAFNQSDPPITLEIEAEWLNLAFSNKEKVDAIVAAVVEKNPNVNKKEFGLFLHNRARVIQSIASYLTSFVDFEHEDVDKHIIELAGSTLAYHLADEETKQKLLSVFQATAEALRQNSDKNLQNLIRKSPLPPADLLELYDWLTESIPAIRKSLDDGDLLEVISKKALPYISTAVVKSITDLPLLWEVLKQWINGKAFWEIHESLSAAGVRIGRDKITVEHTVALCESGFAYELAMVVASLTDLLEPLDEELSYYLSKIQKCIKCGLNDEASIAFYESGFADRIVCQLLGNSFPDATDRLGVKEMCRTNRGSMEDLLSRFPSYFTIVSNELMMSS